MMVPFRYVFIALLLVVRTAPVAAQQAEAGGRLFVEGGRAVNGPSPDFNDRQTATARYEPERMWLVAGGVMFSPRFGVGGEWRAVPDVSFGRGRAVSYFSRTDHERGIFAAAIARVWRSPRGAVEIVGGLGAVRQRSDYLVGGFIPPDPPRETRQLLTDTLPAVTVGADAVLRLVAHAGIAPFARVTWTDRQPAVRAFSAGIAVRGWF